MCGLWQFLDTICQNEEERANDNCHQIMTQSTIIIELIMDNTLMINCVLLYQYLKLYFTSIQGSMYKGTNTSLYLYNTQNISGMLEYILKSYIHVNKQNCLSLYVLQFWRYTTAFICHFQWYAKAIYHDLNVYIVPRVSSRCKLWMI